MSSSSSDYLGIFAFVQEYHGFSYFISPNLIANSAPYIWKIFD